jgi:hypothetical protein
LYATADRLQQGIAEIGRRLAVPIIQGDVLPALVFRPVIEGASLGSIQTALLAHAAQHGVLLRRDPEGISLCLMAAHTSELVTRTLDVINGAVAALPAALAQPPRAG